jgi:hypothetical protein
MDVNFEAVVDKARVYFLTFAASLLLSGAANAHDHKCTAQDATEADAIVDQLHSWQKVNVALKRYGHCDSGSIAEGNSEAVARLLVDQWNTLPTLVRLSKADPGLRRFVIAHVDTTLDTSDLKRIAQLSASSCPSGAASLCDDLRGAATDALNATGH